MFPDRSAEIQIHRDTARQSRGQGNHALARASYVKWVESLRQQNENTGGQLQRELEEAKREYREFVKSDPLYLCIRDAALAKVRQQPGILQTDLYKVLSQFDRADVSYAVYFAADHGILTRTKKGRTYSLDLPTHS